MPDLAVAVFALLAPGRWQALAASATAGSVAGGLISHRLAAYGFAPRAPMTTNRMRAQASAWLRDEGAAGLRHQPLSALPFKVFAAEAPGAGIDALPFVATATVVRGARHTVVGSAFAALGAGVRRLPPRAGRQALSVVVGATLAGFAAGLVLVARRWADAHGDVDAWGDTPRPSGGSA